jgi:hypothetical protein
LSLARLPSLSLRLRLQAKVHAFNPRSLMTDLPQQDGAPSDDPAHSFSHFRTLTRRSLLAQWRRNLAPYNMRSPNRPQSSPRSLSYTFQKAIAETHYSEYPPTGHTCLYPSSPTKTPAIARVRGTDGKTAARTGTARICSLSFQPGTCRFCC